MNKILKKDCLNTSDKEVGFKAGTWATVTTKPSYNFQDLQLYNNLIVCLSKIELIIWKIKMDVSHLEVAEFYWIWVLNFILMGKTSFWGYQELRLGWP